MSAQPEAKGESAPAVSAEVDVQRWTRGALVRTTDQVAEEMPVALLYHDVPHVVMLATPADLDDYAVGFTLSEGLIAHSDEIRGVEVIPGEASVDVKISVAWEGFSQLLRGRPPKMQFGNARQCPRASASPRRSCTKRWRSSRAVSRSTRAPAAFTRR